jgi:hypothetical protein
VGHGRQVEPGRWSVHADTNSRVPAAGPFHPGAGGREYPDAGAFHRATEHVFDQLFNRLARLIGVTGSLALCMRAVNVVRSEFPFLEPAQLGTPDACCAALGEALQTVAPEQARDGVTALLASCLELLASFIGDDLVLILVREIWPGLPTTHDKPGSGGTSDD